MDQVSFVPVTIKNEPAKVRFKPSHESLLNIMTELSIIPDAFWCSKFLEASKSIFESSGPTTAILGSTIMVTCIEEEFTTAFKLKLLGWVEIANQAVIEKNALAEENLKRLQIAKEDIRKREKQIAERINRDFSR